MYWYIIYIYIYMSIHICTYMFLCFFWNGVFFLPIYIHIYRYMKYVYIYIYIYIWPVQGDIKGKTSYAEASRSLSGSIAIGMPPQLGQKSMWSALVNAMGPVGIRGPLVMCMLLRCMFQGWLRNAPTLLRVWHDVLWEPVSEIDGGKKTERCAL